MKKLHALFQFTLVVWIFLVPFVPDVQLSRLKLAGFEFGVFLALMILGLMIVFSSLASVQERFKSSIHIQFLDCAVFLWFLLNIVLWIFSQEKHLATPELRRVVLAFGSYGVFRFALLKEEFLKRFFFAWFLSASLISFYGILQKTGGIGFLDVPQTARVMATYGNPIFFAAYLLPSLFVSTHLLTLIQKNIVRRCVVVGMGLQLAALYLTHTRAAWISVFLCSLLAFFLKSRKRKINPAVIGLGLVVMVGLGILTQDTWKRDQGHLMIWRDTVRLWADQPLTGVGLGAFHTHFPRYAQEDLTSKWPKGKSIVNYTHNEYLQQLAEGGLPLFMVFLSILFIFGRVIAASLGPPLLFLGLASLSLLIQNLFSVDMRFNISFATLFMLMGLTTNVASKNDKPFQFVNEGRPFLSRIPFGLLWIGLMMGLIFPSFLKPYKALKEFKEKPSFFDERLLDPVKTIKEMEKLAKQYPAEPAVLERLAYFYAKEIKNQDKTLNSDMVRKAIAAYQRLIELDPKRVAAYNNYGNTLYTTGNVEQAIFQWEKAVALQDDFLDVRLNLGKIHYLRGNLEEASRHFKKVLQYEPQNADALIYLKKMVE